MGAPIIDDRALDAWLRCERRAWLHAHAPGRARERDGLGPFLAVQRADLRALLAQRFGPAVTASRQPGDAAARRGRTLAALADGAELIGDAVFETSRCTAPGVPSARLRGRIDVLQRHRGGWRAFVLSAGSHIRDHHLRRLALAAEAAAGAGVAVEHTAVLHVDRQSSGGAARLRSKDVDSRTARERERLPGYLDAVAAGLAAVNEPATAIGAHCRRPRPCPFLDHCRGAAAGRTIDQVWGLRASTRRALRSAGWVDMASLPDDPPGLTEDERLALADARRDTLRLERPALATALGGLRPPVAYLDLEFATPAVPWVEGMAPFEPLPFQFSLDVEQADGGIRHVEGLELDAGSDPRPALAAALAAALDEVGSIVVYDASAEGRLLAALAAFQPALANAAERLWDLQEVVMRSVRHPGFEARWDLKQVADTLAHGSYQDLQVGNGLAAQTSWRRQLQHPDAVAERELRRYCAADSRAMVAIVRELRRGLSSATTGS